MVRLLFIVLAFTLLMGLVPVSHPTNKAQRDKMVSLKEIPLQKKSETLLRRSRSLFDSYSTSSSALIFDNDNLSWHAYSYLKFKSISYTMIRPLNRSRLALERRCNLLSFCITRSHLQFNSKFYTMSVAFEI